MNTKRKRSPIAPLGRLFQDALPAEQLDIPDWMRLPPQHTSQFSSLPPHSAAALLHEEITTTRAKSANDAQDSAQREEESPDSIYPPLPQPGSVPPQAESRALPPLAQFRSADAVALRSTKRDERVQTARSRKDHNEAAPQPGDSSAQRNEARGERSRRQGSYSAPPPSARALDGRAQPRDEQYLRQSAAQRPLVQQRPLQGYAASESPWLSSFQDSWPPSSNAPALGSALLSEPSTAEKALDGLRTAIVELEQSKARSLEKMIPELTHLVRSICERVIESEVLHDPNLPLRLVSDAVARLDHSGQVTILLGRAFEASVLKLQLGLEREGIQANVLLVPHRSAFTCEVKADWGAIDASLEARLDEALEKYLNR